MEQLWQATFLIAGTFVAFGLLGVVVHLFTRKKDAKHNHLPHAH
ncbi:hypothetical protein [Deefgea rivuli]|nr:hypothetical protein [Deefgea rivuli]